MVRIKLIEATAARLRREAGSSIPVDVPTLVTREALAIILTSEELPRGMRARYEHERGRIRVRPGLPLDQERFAVAHELGHHFLDHGSVACYDAEFIGDSAPLDEIDVGIDFEAEANRFAGTLLVPRDECRRDMEAGARYPEIARRYAVSLTAATIAVEQYRFRLSRRRR